MTIKEVNVPDARPLIMRLCEYKNIKNVKNAFMPPKTLGMPSEKSSNYGKCMTMDRCIRNVLSGFKNDIAFTTAPMFAGYAMLSNVSQEALIRAGVETVADEATRKLVQWTYDEDDGSEDTDKEKILAELETQATKYKLKERFREAACKDGYFGGCLVYIDVGDLDDVEAEEPLVLDKKTFKKGSLRGFKVIEPINVYPGEYNTDDPTNEHYFNPEFWYVLGKKYHASRFLYIAGNDTPVLLKPAYNFFGIPQAQLALDYVAHFVANRESAQELLNKFSLTCWKTDMTQALQGGSCNDLVSRVKLFNKLKTNNGTMVLNKDTEDMMQINTPLSGVRDIVEMSLNLLTAVWRIPKIKYLGEGEGGLNASSKEQMRSYYDYIMSYKEKVFTQPMETVLKIFQLNLGWDINEAIGFKFPVLWDMDDSERAQLNKQQADRDALYLSNGVLSQEEVRRRLSLDKNSDYTMIDVDDVPEPQEQPLPEVDKEEQNEVDKKAMDSKITMDEKKGWHSRFKSGLTQDGGKGSGNFGHTGREGKVGGSSKVVDLSNDFEKSPTFQEVKEYVNEVIKEGIKFLTGNDDFLIDIPSGQHNKRKIINSNNFQKLNQSGQRRHNKYVMSLAKILKNAQYLGQKENTKKDKKGFVDKYHYFGALVKIGDKEYDLIIDAEQNVGENEIKPQTVHLYNITENDRRYKGLSLDYNPPIVGDIIAQDSVLVKDFLKSFDFGDCLAMDDRWITIGHKDSNEDGEEHKGRHILLKEGEDPKEALERTIKKDLDKDGKVGKKEDTEKKEEKSDPKPEPKKEPKKEDKPEAKEEPKQEKKEPVSEKTPALEYAEFLDKESSEGLSDSEKARKKELEEKEGFGEKAGYKDLSDEELEDKLDNALHERGKILNEIDIAVNNNPEYLKMREEADKLRAESNRLPFGSKERDEVNKKLYALQDKIRHKLEETYRSEREKRNEEYNKLSEPINAMKEEKDKRRKERLKKETEFRDLLDKKILDAMRDELSDEEKVDKFKEIDDIIEKSDFDHFLKDAYRGRIQEQESKASFNTHVNRVKEGLKTYSKKTESLVKDFESIVSPQDKYSSDLEKLEQSSKELRSQKGETPEKEEEIRTKIWQNIMTRSEIQEKISKENKERFEKISEVLRKNGKTNFKVTPGKSTIKGIYDRLNSVLGGVFGENIRTDNAPEVRALKGRAYYNPADNSFKVERNGDFGEVIHEYTHFLEARNPKMLTNSLAFLEYRTKGDKAQSMNSAYTDGRSFKASEVTKKDRFFTPYCGKIYSNSGEYRTGYASEIMSMGVQRLFTEPAKFAKEDREYFDFVIANMRGEL